jgi:hypothetical protein
VTLFRRAGDATSIVSRAFANRAFTAGTNETIDTALTVFCVCECRQDLPQVTIL